MALLLVNVILALSPVLMSIVSSAAQGAIQISFEVEEEVAGQRKLGNLIAVGNLTSVSQTYISSMQYSIISTEENVFTVDNKGDFFVNSRIDREQECPRQTSPSCIMQISVFAQSAPQGWDIFNQMINIDIYIIDTNDNFPIFELSSVNIDIQEGVFPGENTKFPLPSATDLDTGANNSIQRYEIEPVGSSFNVVEENGELSLALNKPLDRESFAFYTVKILAIDGGSPSLTGTLTVNITVTDINDNRPSFIQSEYNVTVNEIEELGSVILTVSASDRDAGENQKVSYFFKNSASDPILTAIGLNESTGDVYVTGNFDSVGGPYEVIIEARDHGSPVRDSDPDVRILINVIDTNDNAPVIKVFILVPEDMVNENSTRGFAVAHIQVSDADSGSNSQVQCESQSNEFTLSVTVPNAQYKVQLDAALDYETKTEYEITINCTDLGTPPRSSLETFIIYVRDVNDNSPIFTQAEYFGSVVENNVPEFVITKVSATDRDSGFNSEIRYFFTSGIQDHFILEENTGIIKARDALDREQNSTYRFQVTAMDSGAQPFSNVTMVTIEILDENDNRPVFVGDSYSMQVFENENVSTSVGQVTAHDIDNGNNGTISYQIPAKYSTYPLRILDDGTVVTTAKLDREAQSGYDFEIVAMDHGEPPKSSSIPVTVLVLDRNDNTPNISFPSGANNSVSIATVTEVGVAFTSVVASDEDENKNGELKYGIVSGNIDKLFDLSEKSGEMILVRKIEDHMKAKTYELLISVEDQGEVQHSERTTLEIHIFVRNETTVAAGMAISKGQNILIAITISCVTFVLSVIIIIIICVIRRKDRQKHLYNAKAYDQQKIVSSMHRGSNRSSSSKGSGDQMIHPETTGNGVRRNKKEVSFSLDEMDGTVAVTPNPGQDQFDTVSTFKNGHQVNAYEMTAYHQESQPPPKPERLPASDDKKHREINRIASLRVHQALLQTQNNNNNTKPWPSSPPAQEEGKGSGGLIRGPLEDCHSESSGEITATDSGRGGSEEDIRSSTNYSHDADELRNPNSSHPFYTSENQQPTFSSFRGNSVHKTGPILSSFLSRDVNKRQSPSQAHNSFPMNDLNRDGERNRDFSQHHSSPGPYHNVYGHKQNKMDADSHPQVAKLSQLNIANSYEDDSVQGTARSNDDDDTTTSGSYTLNEDNYLSTDVSDMFYKPQTFV